ncbi:HEPN domain-containing protein [Streptomyces sp. NBC_01077]|uniref:hypothetical protein n=1 Tax=Streptomyces sp. NBC_01077 TaxID=2903746 RepID=UPI003865C6DF|nr:HEPN domain-containing protein [Streptomyces sp. NBC_01077]
MTTADGQSVEFTDVRVEPVISEASGHSSELHRVISTVIPGAASAGGRVWPDAFAPPESVVIARDSGSKPFDLREPLSQRIERFLLLVRLLKPGTSESMLEIQGETHPVREFKPIVVRFRGAGPGFASPTQLAARVITLGSEDVGRVDGLGRLLDAAQQARPEMVFTSFAMAMQKFLLSFHAHVWYEQIVDLATAFEAVLSGKEKDDVTLRLKTRAATLLSTDLDPADKIFKDVGVIYALRSKLVHGGAMKKRISSRTSGRSRPFPMACLPEKRSRTPWNGCATSSGAACSPESASLPAIPRCGPWTRMKASTRSWSMISAGGNGAKHGGTPSRRSTPSPPPTVLLANRPTQ